MGRLEDIEARAVRATEALSVGGSAGALLTTTSIIDDIPWLCKQLRAVSELVEICKWNHDKHHEGDLDNCYFPICEKFKAYNADKEG